MNTNGDSNHRMSNNRGDDEDRKLFLGGLSWETTEEDVRTYFSKYGHVVDVSIKYDAVSGNPRGFGFITFANNESVDSVLNALPHSIKNKTIDPKRAKSRPICKKIFVGGLDSNIPEEDIKKFFSKFGPVEGIELPYDRQKNKRREFCFVIFESEDAADAACSQAKQVVGNKECDIKKAQPQPVAQQQKRMMIQGRDGFSHGDSHEHGGFSRGGRGGRGGSRGGGRGGGGSHMGGPPGDYSNWNQAGGYPGGGGGGYPGGYSMYSGGAGGYGAGNAYGEYGAAGAGYGNAAAAAAAAGYGQYDQYYGQYYQYGGGGGGAHSEAGGASGGSGTGPEFSQGNGSADGAFGGLGHHPSNSGGKIPRGKPPATNYHPYGRGGGGGGGGH